jgi:hypothetical protein
MIPRDSKIHANDIGYSSTNYRVLDAPRVGTGAVEMRGGCACAVLAIVGLSRQYPIIG